MLKVDFTCAFHLYTLRETAMSVTTVLTINWAINITLTINIQLFPHWWNQSKIFKVDFKCTKIPSIRRRISQLIPHDRYHWTLFFSLSEMLHKYTMCTIRSQKQKCQWQVAVLVLYKNKRLFHHPITIITSYDFIRGTVCVSGSDQLMLWTTCYTQPQQRQRDSAAATEHCITTTWLMEHQNICFCTGAEQWKAGPYFRALDFNQLI